MNNASLGMAENKQSPYKSKQKAQQIGWSKKTYINTLLNTGLEGFQGKKAKPIRWGPDKFYSTKKGIPSHIASSAQHPRWATETMSTKP